jgi:Protein of unknown function (DUF1572)
MDRDVHFLETAKSELERLKRLGEKAMAQIPSDSDFYMALDRESNSIAVLLQHLAGNMVSRWTDFLTADGEKPDRHRDREFELDTSRGRKELLALWERGWACLFESLGSLTPEDLEKRVRIRGEEHTVPEAIQRQIIHTAYHLGQIVLLAKHAGSESWTSLTIARGESAKAGGGYKKR